VIDGACRLTNLDWELEARALGEEIGIPATTLLNDFESVGHALALLGPEDCVSLQEGRARRRLSQFVES
jgi:glucokinase